MCLGVVQLRICSPCAKSITGKRLAPLIAKQFIYEVRVEVEKLSTSTSTLSDAGVGVVNAGFTEFRGRIAAHAPACLFRAWPSTMHTVYARAASNSNGLCGVRA